ncbi:MAG: hypothetical protein EON52_24635, partial [Actinomycetales bacterium]
MGARVQRPEPRAHWVLFGLLLVVVLVLLVISGVTGGQLGESQHAPESRRSSVEVPEAVLEGGPIVDPARGTAGLRVPAGHVVLTFDDGPTAWTAKILDVLDRHQVKGTFFVIGSKVAERPDLVRRMRDEGHEVGVHSFTHVNLANVSGWRLRVELDQTQLAIAAATGRTTDLLRPPFSSKAASVSGSDWRSLTRTRGYRVVYTDLDTEDWRRPGVEKIVAAGLPVDGRGAVVMLHDGGGNRAQTVAAVEQLVETLQDRGYEFDTVTDAVGVAPAWHRATRSQEVRSAARTASARNATRKKSTTAFESRTAPVT